MESSKHRPPADSSSMDGGSEGLYRMMVESAEDFAIFALDMDGKIITWNPGAERIFGFHAEQVVGQDASLLFVPEDREQQIPEAEIRTAMESGRARDERWHVCKDGRRFWADGVLMPLQDSLGNMHGFLKILRDRTEFKRLQDEVRMQKERADKLEQQLQALQNPPAT